MSFDVSYEIKHPGVHDNHVAQDSRAALAHEAWAQPQGKPHLEKTDVLAREKEMEQRYPGIEFVHAGASLGPKIDMDGKAKKSSQLVARDPSMKELVALDSALSHSAPACKDPTGKLMKIGFTRDNPVDGGDPRQSPGAAYEPADPTHTGFSYLRVFPAASAMPASQKDLSKGERSDISSPHSLEAVLDHELGHATQDHTGGLDPAADAAYKRAAGWIPLSNPPSDRDGDWALRGKDGYVYKRAGQNGDEHWLRLEGGNKVDKDGRYIGAGYDANGKYEGHFVGKFGKTLPAKSDGTERGAAAISTPEMYGKALVKPVGMYFPMPQEEVAEAMRAYRTGVDTRAILEKTNPQLYKVAKDLDQLELDRAYGRGMATRASDGRIVRKS